MLQKILTIVFLVGLTIAMYFVVNHMPKEVQYERFETEKEEVLIQEPWMTDEEAIQAAKDVVRKKELQAELKGIDDEIAKMQAKRKEVAAELQAYWSEDRVKTLIRRAFPEEPSKAVAIATCESGLNSTAYNPTNGDGSTDGGLWQINSVHDKRLKELGLNKYDPEDATKFARMLYEERGKSFKDWVCYTKKMHVAFLR